MKWIKANKEYPLQEKYPEEISIYKSERDIREKIGILFDIETELNDLIETESGKEYDIGELRKKLEYVRSQIDFGESALKPKGPQ